MNRTSMVEPLENSMPVLKAGGKIRDTMPGSRTAPEITKYQTRLLTRFSPA